MSPAHVKMPVASITEIRELGRSHSALLELIVVFVGSFAVSLALRYYSLFPSVIDTDESLYLIMAHHWLQGELPYQSVWDQHTVGLPAFFALIQLLFGDSIAAIRVSAVIAIAGTATILYFTGRLIERRTLAGAAAAAFYIAWTARWWGLSANCELYLNILLAGAMHILIREGLSPSPRKRQLFRYCLASLFLGLAVQVKQVAIAETALFFGVLYAVYRNDPRWKTALLATVLCFLLPSLLVAIYFAFHGLAIELFRAVVLYNLVYVSTHPTWAEISARVPRSFVLPVIIVIAAAVSIWRHSDRRHGLLLGWAVAAAIDVATPGQFWDHYFILLLPSAALLTGYLAVMLERAWPWPGAGWRQVRLLLVAAAFLSCNPFNLYREIARSRDLADDDTPRSIARMIGDRHNEYIFVFNYEPIIYFLTGARLPTKYVLPGDWGNYRDVAGLDPLEEIDNIFSLAPAFIIFIDSDFGNMSAAAVQRLDDHLTDYERFSTITDNLSVSKPLVQIYARRPKSGP